MNEFYGVIKLVDGTEIVGSVVPCDEEDGFVVENPFEISVELISTPAGEMYKVDMRPWVKFSKEDIFFIEKNKVFTVAEADNKILTLYRSTLKKFLNKQEDNRVSLDKELGFKNKIEEARELLEKSFRLNIDT
jgi:hypothetical protein